MLDISLTDSYNGRRGLSPVWAQIDQPKRGADFEGTGWGILEAIQKRTCTVFSYANTTL